MEFISQAIKACKEVKTLLESSEKSLKKRLEIGAGGDISRVADIEAEKIFIKHLGKFGKIISEESGVIGFGEDEIVLDPLDGSDNYISDLPYYGCSIAYKKKSQVVASVVANFANGDIFIKSDKKKEKAKLDNPVFSEIIRDDYATIGIYERAYASKRYIYEINKLGLKYRSPGALALSLAYAHYFRFVLFEGRVRSYDVEAGLHMCSDLNIYRSSDFLIVSRDKLLFEQLKEVTK